MQGTIQKQNKRGKNIMSMNSYDMSWAAASEAFESNGPKVTFMKLQAGMNRVRIGSRPSKVYQHWEPTLAGKQMKVTCIGNNCPICKLGHQPVARYQMKVLDKVIVDQPEAKVLEIGNSIMRSIANCANDPEYGDPSNYDIRIQKEGVGKETKYSVLASPKQIPLTDAEKAILAGLPSMSEINKELSAEDIMKLPLKCFHTDDDLKNTSSNDNISGRNKEAAATDWDSIGV